MDSSSENAAQLWLYFFPLLLMQLTRAADADVPSNTWTHGATFRDADFTSVIRPNVDTRYSHAWLDLTTGPVALHVPEVPERYYVVQAVDEWTRTFSLHGTRTNGSKATTIVYATEQQALDAGALWPDSTVVVSPTPSVWLRSRIQSNGPTDHDAVSKLQAQFVLETRANTPRSHTATVAIPLEATQAQANGKPPPQILLTLDPDIYFAWAAKLWARQETALPASDVAIVVTASTFGFDRSGTFNLNARSTEQRAALQTASRAGMAAIRAEAPQQGGVVRDGWYYLRDNWYEVDRHLVAPKQPINYTMRAALSWEALGFLPVHEASYVAAGVPQVGVDPLDGSGGATYALRFENGQRPPVDAFWSLTVYTKAGYLVDNPMGRFNIGSRDNLAAAKDGSVTILLSSKPPTVAGAGDANWLPVPEGEFALQLRAYLPTQPIHGGDDAWHAPQIVRL